MRIRSAAAWPLVLGAFVCACTEAEKAGPPPPPVEVAAVLQRDVPVMIENIGQTIGSTEVEVRARSEGFLESVNFKEGSFVRKGDLLYTIDPKNLEATLAQSKAELAKSQADYARARQDVARYKPLVALNAIPRQQYDTAVAVESANKAVVEAAQAAVENAAINLTYTKIYSPIDGLVGKTEVKAGNLVGRGQNTLLTTVSTIDPIHVRFTISEQDYLKYARADRSRPDGEKENRFELVLADGSVHPQRGSLVFADRIVDPTTGTLMLEATFPNPDGFVRPGQYGRVRTAVDVRKNAILVPQRAVKELQATYSVAVVGADDKVAMRTIKPGVRLGSLWVVESGLAAGEKIVVEGLQKVREGMTVKPTLVTLAEDGAISATPEAAANAPAAAGQPAANAAATSAGKQPAAASAGKQPAAESTGKQPAAEAGKKH